MKQAGWFAVAGCAVLLLQAMPETLNGGDEAVPWPLPRAAPKPADAAPASQAAVAGGQDLLELINTDKLHGNLLGVTAGEYGLKWKHGSVEKPMDVSLATIRRVELASPRKVKSGAPATAAIYLSNGDMFLGSVVSLGSEKLVVDTGYAGRLNVNRHMVKSITPRLGASAVVFEGPGALTDWATGQDAQVDKTWTCMDGVLSPIQDGEPIGRYIKGMPDLADIRFEAAWRRENPYFWFMFYADNIQDNCNGYMLQMNGSGIFLERHTQENGSHNLGTGSDDYEGFHEGRIRQALFNLLVDKKKKTFALLLNGNLIRQWTEPDSFAGKGNGIVFSTFNDRDLQVSRIRIAQWDGRLPEAGGSRDKVIKEDLLRFVNNDKVSGQLKSITNGVAKFEASYATLDVPLARVSELVIATEKTGRARKNKEDVRATFADEGVLTFQLLRIEKDEIKGKSENFGDLSLPLGVLRALNFNLDQEQKPSEEEPSAAPAEEGVEAE